MKNTLTINTNNNCVCDCLDYVNDGSNTICLVIIVGDVKSPKFTINDTTTALKANYNNTIDLNSALFGPNAKITFKYSDENHTGNTFTITFPDKLEGNLTIKRVDNFNYNAKYTVPGSSGGSSYTLPVASTDVLGGVKIGAGMGITPDGSIYTTLENTLSVKSAGCVGDGTTDDTANFKKAISQACDQGKMLYIDAGTYLITDRLIIDKTLNIVGASQTDSIIKYRATYYEESKYSQEYYEESNACFIVTASNCELKDFTIQGGESKYTASKSNGIIMHYTKPNGTQYDAAQRVALTNLDIKCFKNGVFLYAGWNRYITRCNFIDNSDCGVKYYPLEIDTVGQWAASGDVYIACQFIGNTYAGFYGFAAFETTIWNSVFEYNKKAIYTNNCRDVCFKNCWNEANDENLFVRGSCKFEGGYNINNGTVDHELIGGNDLIQFEAENLITMCRERTIIFSQSSGVITKGVELGAELENLVKNPYFEEASGGTGTLPSTNDWNCYPTWFSSVVEDEPNYLKMSGSGLTSDTYYGAWAASIAVNATEKYTISAWIKAEARSAIDSGGVMCYIAWKNSSGETIVIDNRPITMIGDNIWEQKEFICTAPNQATTLIVGWGLTRNGTIFLKEPMISHDDGIYKSNVIVRRLDLNTKVISFLDASGNLIGTIDLESEV